MIKDCEHIDRKRYAHGLCQACYHHNWWIKNKNKPEVRNKRRIYADSIREKVLKYYGNKCVKCGYDEDIRALDVDHVLNDGAWHRSEVGKSSYAVLLWIIRNNYPATFQLLCANCNRLKYLDYKYGRNF